MTKEIDFKRYLSSNVQSVRKALRELIVENCAYEIIQVTHVSTLILSVETSCLRYCALQPVNLLEEIPIALFT